MTHDPIDILLAHNAWANAKVLDRCRSLSEEELHRKFEMGLGSIHDTIHHNIAGYRWWTDRIADREPRPFLKSGESRHTLAELEQLGAEAEADMRQVAADLKSNGHLTEILISRIPPGKKFSRTTALMHACTHAIHHRAQILNMLRQLRPKEEPLELDVTAWQIETES
ncbi:MAG TPA: DinB family protein [Phycisphaerales bacterium]|nr:DinB family protein [Phycisphaerales bacterium]